MLTEGAPYSGGDDPWFEIDKWKSHDREFTVNDNKHGITVRLPVKLLLDRTFVLQDWYAQQMRNLQVYTGPGQHGDGGPGPDDDSSDPGDDDQHPPGPGGDNGSSRWPNRHLPPGDPGSPHSRWLSWTFVEEEVEEEWDDVPSLTMTDSNASCNH